MKEKSRYYSLDNLTPLDKKYTVILGERSDRKTSEILPEVFIDHILSDKIYDAPTITRRTYIQNERKKQILFGD